MKKILAGALIGAFIFNVGVINSASATSIPIDKAPVQAQDNNKNNSDMKNPPEPPKDENGNPMPPPDKNKSDNNKNNSDMKNPPEPPKDENGNPMPPPDKKSDNNKNHQQKK